MASGVCLWVLFLFDLVAFVEGGGLRICGVGWVSGFRVAMFSS